MKYKYSQYTKNFFSKIDTEDKAYILGILFADGCVGSNKNRITLSLHKKDREILMDIKNSLKLDNPLFKIPDKNQASIRFHSKKVKNDLIKHGCTPKKSLNLQPPATVPEKLEHHFIRGYVDGDGSFYTYEENTYKNKTYTRFGFNVLGTYDFINWVKSKIPSKSYINKEGKVFRLQSRSKKGVINIGDYIYNNANLYMSRKYNKYLLMKDSL